MFLLFGFLGLLFLKAFFLSSESYQYNITRSNRAQQMQNYMDDNVNPCDDFYEFACGNWEKFNPIAEDNVENNEFVKLNAKLLNQMKGLLDKSVDDSDWQVKKKSKDFYASCTNLAILRTRGLTPLLEFLKSVGGWPLLDDNWSGAKFDWIDLVTTFKAKYGLDILLSATVYDNLRDVNQNQIYISETSTSLPNKDYYYDHSKSYQLTAYKEYLIDVFKLFGVSGPKAENISREILKFETDVAMGTIDKNVRPDLQSLVIPMTVDDLQSKYPDIDWTKFIENSLEITINGSQPIIVLGDEYIPNLLRVISSANQKVIANYIMWMVTKSLLKYTDDRFDKAEQKYLEAVVGSHKRGERWKECISPTQNALGLAVASMYIEKHFSNEIRTDVRNMSEKLKITFQNTLDDSDWIDDITKERLHEKIENMQLEIGYPEIIMSEDSLNEEYGDIEVHPEKYFENVLNVLKHHQYEERKKLSRKVDKKARFSPITANAFNEATRNRIIIPAGILQYPIYNRHFPKSVNFGQIGAILGHEIIHGFDDIGQNFDPNGNMVKWWTVGSTENFKNRTLCFVSQYNNYTYEGYKLRGDVSVGENIAEIGGLRQAFYAYKKWLNDQDNEDNFAETLPNLNFTNTQLFFLSYAQLWCSAHKSEALRHKVNVDNHMPSKYRVIGALSNFEEFAAEFQCPVGSNMNPSNKCKMW